MYFGFNGPFCFFLCSLPPPQAALVMVLTDIAVCPLTTPSLPVRRVAAVGVVTSQVSLKHFCHNFASQRQRKRGILSHIYRVNLKIQDLDWGI